MDSDAIGLARDIGDSGTAGSGLNVNGDDAAAALAGALAADELVLVADVAGVLDNGVVIRALDLEQAGALVAVEILALDCEAAPLERRDAPSRTAPF